jgi:hypothetical protein
MATGGSKVVEHSITDPEIVGSNPTTAKHLKGVVTILYFLRNIRMGPISYNIRLY